MSDEGNAGPKERVYLIAAPPTTRYKIGRSIDIPKRFRAIQLMSPVPLRLLWAHPGGRSLEMALHARLQDRRLHGEWFDFEGVDDVVALVVNAIPEDMRAPEGTSYRVSDMEAGVPLEDEIALQVSRWEVRPVARGTRDTSHSIHDREDSAYRSMVRLTSMLKKAMAEYKRLAALSSEEAEADAA